MPHIVTLNIEMFLLFAPLNMRINYTILVCTCSKTPVIIPYTKRILSYFLTKFTISGAYAGFLKGGGATLKFLGFWIYMPQSGMLRAAKLRAFARGVWGACSPKKILKNGAISCYFQQLSW